VPILIDGHNLIGRCPGLSLHDPDDEEKLVRLLVAYAARAGKRVTVVFDPGELATVLQTRRLGGVEAVFAPYGRSADALIVQRVQRSRHPGEWLVVTSDQKLAEQVARLGARTRDAQTFAAEACTPAAVESEQKQTPPSPDEVESWMKLFQGGTE
jgi:predicted RNA-binding protein with PIN domain